MGGRTVLGIIGGSGLYQLEGLERARWESVESPFGAPSDALLVGEPGGVELAFLPRHGRGHVLSPSAINCRANIDALKRVGATDLISVSACRSLREDLPPGRVVLVDQFVDRSMLGPERVPSPAFIERALDTAIITAPAARDPARVRELGAVARRVLHAR